jgi:hypothetical protein
MLVGAEDDEIIPIAAIGLLLSVRRDEIEKI